MSKDSQPLIKPSGTAPSPKPLPTSHIASSLALGAAGWLSGIILGRSPLGPTLLNPRNPTAYLSLTAAFCVGTPLLVKFFTTKVLKAPKEHHATIAIVSVFPVLLLDGLTVLNWGTVMPNLTPAHAIIYGGAVLLVNACHAISGTVDFPGFN
eukprot:comp24519_c0_seq1/m.46766 comp24519_c0_seq1/g.46766  ORF comp24519_c0_seq1/g.46766 comp24519_c0_seq1/m.46766 type:complete len:152 (-) comp24519_c0_seq1:398-853(-)